MHSERGILINYKYDKDNISEERPVNFPSNYKYYSHILKIKIRFGSKEFERTISQGGSWDDNIDISLMVSNFLAEIINKEEYEKE